jgi:hypothetical protein
MVACNLDQHAIPSMTCSIFIKSFPKDFGWLNYCLKSIHRFATGFDEIVVVIPEGSDLSLTQERVVKVQEPGPSASSFVEHGAGYAFQQVVKMNADKYCQSDFILHMDSDTIFTHPVTPKDLMVLNGFNENPLWLMTPFSEILPTDKNLAAHVESMRAFSGIDPEFEYMRRAGQIIPRWAYGCFREYCISRHGKTFEEYAMAQGFRGVSEFNFMGQFLHREFHNFIHFHDTRFGIPESFVNQAWSWGGLDAKKSQELEAALA